mmetsp:Transcript_42023/g.37242  ORF Transcript_42023/g.37242 Transcript_42023/m.37242 type:complete len:729 (-) Transcript_42023:66-2252(-)
MNQCNMDNDDDDNDNNNNAPPMFSNALPPANDYEASPPPPSSNQIPIDIPPKSPPSKSLPQKNGGNNMNGNGVSVSPNPSTPQKLDYSHTGVTPEPFVPPPPPAGGSNVGNQSNSASGGNEPGLSRVPPPPVAYQASPSKPLPSAPSPRARAKHIQSYSTNSPNDIPPPPMGSNNGNGMGLGMGNGTGNKGRKRERAGRNTQPPPKMHSNHVIVSSEPNLQLGINGADEFKFENIDQVSFTNILRQVDVGVEMTDRLKEVIRKFCKHQQMGADKLQEIYGKLPSTYQDTDGMKEFADLCALVHTLILETVSAQKRLADFLFKDVVPKMDTYIKQKQQQIQQLKKDNQQAEMKLKNSINSMNKAANTAKTSAMKAKQIASTSVNKKQYDTTKTKKSGFGSFMTKIKSNPNSHLSEEEQAYLKAQTNQKNYEAAVMAANYEQDTYDQIQARFKRDCKNLEQQRLQYCHGKIQQFVNAHRSYFNNETIMVLQTRILSGLDSLDSNREFDNFLGKVMKTQKKGSNHGKTKKFEAKKYDYQNVFHSLQDSMDITNKLAPHAKLPLMLTSLCNKVRELNGFDTEGIFRKSAMATEIDRIKLKLASNDYTIDSRDPHVAACLLKDWLRGLKDSLIPQTHYDMAISMAKKNEIKQESLEVFLSQLPEVNRETIKYLVKFLKDLIEDKHIGNTKMNLENVAIVFAPTILKCPHTDSKILLANSKHEKAFTEKIITEL